MKPPSPLLINFNPLWINTFIKYNTNESLETNEIKDIQNPSLTLLLLDSAAIKLCWVIALKISLHLLSSSVLVSLSVGGEQTIWCLVPAHTLSWLLPGGEYKLQSRPGAVRLPYRWGDVQAEFWGRNRGLRGRKEQKQNRGNSMLKGRTQREKDKYHMISLICGILKKKKDTNELIYKTKIDPQT